MSPPLPASLRAILDEDLGRIRGELGRLAPDATLVLAGSLAFDEPWARRDGHGSWKLESDYDLYLVVPTLRRVRALRREEALRDLQLRLGTRAPVDPFVAWRPLVERGLTGMVGRDLASGAFVDCPLDPRTLRVNQLRKALLRTFLLAPRELPERASYQWIKAAIEALRAVILVHTPALSTRALFSVRANLRWLASHPGHLEPGDAGLLRPALEARLDLGADAPDAASMGALRAWLVHFARTRAQDLLPPHGARPTPTAAKAWLGMLSQGLVPDPRVDWDRTLLSLLADPLASRVADEPAQRATLEERYRHLALVPPLRQGALLRGLDGALGSPGSTKGERYLLPVGSPP